MPATTPTEAAAAYESDALLVNRCLDGDEAAWAALIQKYKQLIYSIPRKYGAGPEDAADIFQAVCVELLAELPRLRRASALRAWLITVSAHHSYQWKRRQQRRAVREYEGLDPDAVETDAMLPPAMFEEAELEQAVREAVGRLPKRCAALIRMLFYEQPPLPYRTIAARLGLALGSVGFIRARCLKKLETMLGGIGSTRGHSARPRRD
jgi:RNA polymerase sigma factor (sigma-70 family)